MSAKPLGRRSNIVVQQTGDELLIYDLNIHKAFCLNETSAMVWQLCDGKNTASDISVKMSQRLGTLVSEDLVWLALDQFVSDSLLESGEMVVSHLAGVARREMIRKVGLASLIALPFISSVIAPKAAAAQSTCVACNCASTGLVACTRGVACLTSFIPGLAPPPFVPGGGPVQIPGGGPPGPPPIPGGGGGGGGGGAGLGGLAGLAGIATGAGAVSAGARNPNNNPTCICALGTNDCTTRLQGTVCEMC